MIYLDHAATTPLDPAVRAAMLPWLDDVSGFGNPASDHAPGRRARAAVEAARAQVAQLIGAQAEEIVWTSGATESNNLAIKGALEFRGMSGAHIVSSRIEHKSVLDTCRYLESQGVRVAWLDPGRDGGIAVEQVLAALRPETLLVSLMWVNNETGVINPVVELAPQLRARGILFHVDAVQAAGRLPIDLAAVPIDLLSLSAHKFYGPKGIGALFVRKRPRARLAPQMHGGGHEQGMRAGTLATHQIAGMGMAAALARERLDEDAARIAALRDRLWQKLGGLPGVLRNGDPARTVPQILNLSFEGVEGESLRARLPGLAVSSGSACSAATREPSYVLRALGRDDELAGASLRFSLGRGTTGADIDAAAAQLIGAVESLRCIAHGGSSGTESTHRGGRASVRDADDESGPYPQAVWRRFIRPAHVGTIAGAVHARARTPAARAQLDLSLRLDPLQARFSAYGCPYTLAVGEWLAETLEREGAAVLRRIDAAAIRAALEIPEARAHCALMGEDVVRSLWQQIESTA
ncbi:aminotransferase class V-fold PLP-dependent enzyme [Fontimonas sp. SYSU GA230001]|uniref:cysteine desulfurase family protein n=1 Tax=Fontimonas sp. SYSU GA230001 TaxID=3142450 RepID=UPI0032B51E28